ncbi:2-C-methyl-D-erythritol 4-phosphate cytidylyltransferase [Pontibacillus yanchengensis]|uniref:2-C-methyl-D-erythritol 4-phosphate cytidylyltransferase n=2 Tax=Pontibacillus yanchengensis TaxID=462910 RepID=A0ACC7VMD5_9BACI|nr:2-C-methyl-D-erythritol 4-phosphate cytidylyltransferase [Pontibacillus yanchengensis]MYL35916.1 2-C-methyl-D-erythritol 4-phosphate cytidylyltransferase [Pontibacillus yanchengensis]MYL55636.1 2-C-methyl-D-erythritol 4-phosphate cytidylyltransferase [Pontibacillus yanchengensis]
MVPYQIIILAAGQGKRMRAKQNKQFICLEDKPLIVHTLDVFNEDHNCTSINLVINPNEQSEMENLIACYKYMDKVKFVHGGTERQDSVYQGLKACDSKEGVVLIHDGARPFVKKDNLDKLTEEAERGGAALLAVPVTDTIKRKTASGLTSLNRSELWAAQTPQAFHFSIIEKAHEHAKNTGFLGTDDASLVEQLRLPVEIVQGSYDNIKLTTPEDVEKAQAILNKRSMNEGE